MYHSVSHTARQQVPALRAVPCVQQHRDDCLSIHVPIHGEVRAVPPHYPAHPARRIKSTTPVAMDSHVSQRPLEGTTSDDKNAVVLATTRGENDSAGDATAASPESCVVQRAQLATSPSPADGAADERKGCDHPSCDSVPVANDKPPAAGSSWMWTRAVRSGVSYCGGFAMHSGVVVRFIILYCCAFAGEHTSLP